MLVYLLAVQVIRELLYAIFTCNAGKTEEV
jgi:hypothetical protein